MTDHADTTAVPPGTCLTHGYHGKTVCPKCSTAIGPFLDVNPSPVSDHADMIRPQPWSASDYYKELRDQRQQAIDALREIDELPEGSIKAKRIARAALLSLGEQE